MLLNGLPGSGKSTLARRYAAEHPPATVVDVDTVRAGLDHPDLLSDDAGLQAREVALELPREHLLAGHDVLVPQFLGRSVFVEALERLAASVGAGFVEVILAADPAELVQRLVARTTDRPEHALAAGLLARAGGTCSLGAARQQLEQMVATRPGTHVVPSTGSPDEALQALDRLLADPSAG